MNAQGETEDQLFDQAQTLSRDWKGNILELGQTLAALRRESPARFAEWLGQPGVSRRRAYYLVEIAESYDSLSIEKGRLDRLGWTKLKEMAGQINQDNAADLVERAERSTVMQLRHHLLEKQDADDVRTMVLHLTRSQYQELSEALILGGAKKTSRGLSGKEEAVIKLIRAALRSKKAIKTK